LTVILKHFVLHLQLKHNGMSSFKIIEMRQSAYSVVNSVCANKLQLSRMVHPKSWGYFPVATQIFSSLLNSENYVVHLASRWISNRLYCPHNTQLTLYVHTIDIQCCMHTTHSKRCMCTKHTVNAGCTQHRVNAVYAHNRLLNLYVNTTYS
jgi:hypothetical protein